jgi:AcrR family transcriptional regulator
VNNVEKKLDRRQQRTRQLLRDALVALILERGFDALTIQDITERADLRRATFYLHYKDKEELLLTVLQAMFDDLVSQIMPLMQDDLLAGKTQLEPFLVTFRHVHANRDLYGMLLNSQAGAMIARRIRDYLAAFVIKGLAATPPEALDLPKPLLANYLAGAEMGLITWWLDTETPYSVEAMAQTAHRLILHGVLDVLKR